MINVRTITTAALALSLAASTCVMANHCGDEKAHKHDGEKHAAHAAKATAYGIGSKVEDFTLVEPKSGKDMKFSEAAGKKATVLIFWNQECPYVVEAQSRVADFSKAMAEKGVNVVAIDGGAVNSIDEIKEYASKQPFTMLANPDSKIAAKFGVTRTPEVFVLDKDMKVAYHGAFDNGKRGEKDGRKSYAADAVQAVLEGKAPAVTKVPAFGCSLKYADGVKPCEPAEKEAKS